MKRWKSVVAAAGVTVLAAGACTDADDNGGTGGGPQRPGPAPEEFELRVLVDGLADPWEVSWGPDGYLWVTEKTAGRVTRVAVADGATQTALTIPDVVATEDAQDGLLGMALHPELLTGEPYVYLAYTYDAAPDAPEPDRRGKLVRYTYDEGAGTLDDPADLLTGLPASIDHNSGRLVFGPDEMLYYTIGDQGNNQFTRFCEPILAQRLPTAAEVAAEDWTAYQGKILRLELDGSVPVDNPVLADVRSHVYSYGHRNAQGIAFGPGDRLYSSEHGPKSDDEVNLIEAGGNYGWPYVSGYADDQAYVYANWSASEEVPCPELSYSDFEIPPSVPQQPESAYQEPHVEPLRTFYTVPSDHDFQDPACAPVDFLCWPTVAPSGLDAYTDPDGIPGWADSLLMPTLKEGAVYRLPLSDDGTVVGEPVVLWSTVDRYRDIALNPDGVTFYVATDTRGLAVDESGRPAFALANPGAILEFHLVR